MQRSNQVHPILTFILLALTLLTFLFRGAIFNGLTITSISSFAKPGTFYSELHLQSKDYDQTLLLSSDNELVWNSVRKLLHREITEGKLPFWNPYVTNGMPFMAEEQTQATDPLYLLLNTIFSPEDVVVFFVGLSFLFAGLWMFLLARELKIQLYGSIVTGIAYMFSGPLVVWYMRPNIQTYVYLPLLFFAFERGIRTEKKYWPFIAGIAIALMLLSGHTQMVVLALLWYEIFLIHRLLRNKRIAWKPRLKQLAYWNLYPGLVAFCFSAYKLFPFIELSLQSPILRSGRAGLHPLTWTKFIDICFIGKLFKAPYEVGANMLKLVLPYYFGSPATGQSFLIGGTYYQPFGGNFAETATYFGIVSLLFAILVLFRIKKFPPQIKSYAICFIFGFLICFDFPIIGIIRALPILNLIELNRSYFIIALSGAILAGQGLEYFCALSGNSRARILLIFICSIILFFGAHAIISQEHTPLHNDYFFHLIPVGILTIALAGNFVTKKRPSFSKQIPLLFISLAIVDSLLFAYDFMAFQPPEILHPETPRNKIISTFANPIFRFKYLGSFYPSFNLAYDGLMMDSTFSVLQINRQNQFIRAVAKESNAIVPSHQGTVNTVKSKWLDINGVALVGIDQNYNQLGEAENNANLMPMYLDTDITLWQNRSVLPRFHAYSNYILEEDLQAIVHQLESETFDYTNTIFVSPSTPPHLSYIVETDQPIILGVSDTWYPGWKVEVDGEEGQLLIINHAFRGIEVDTGKQKVRMFYKPFSLYSGLLITFFSLIATGTYWGIHFLKKNRSKEGSRGISQ